MTFTDYNGYTIAHDAYGRDEYTVDYCGDDVWFEDIADAMDFIDQLPDDL